jgi:saccharopine dehydrogenase-like NADP-dependent oxidoreductase
MSDVAGDDMRKWAPRRVVQHLLDHGFAVRVASRHPERSAQVFSSTSSALEFVRADVGDDGSVMTALAGAFGVVNAVSLSNDLGPLSPRQSCRAYIIDTRGYDSREGQPQRGNAAAGILLSNNGLASLYPLPG